MKNKRGQGMSTQTIILLVLGLVILAVLILGFTLGWKKITPFLSDNNVDSIKSSCDVACSLGSTYGFCSEPRDFKAADLELEGTTCDTLSKSYPQYGIGNCSGVSCVTTP